MSSLERNTGTLRPVSREFVESVLQENVPGWLELHGNIYDAVGESFHDKLIPNDFEFICDQWYMIENHCRSEVMSWAELVESPGGLIEFDTCHYNGGGCLGEVLKRAMMEWCNESE